MSNRLLKKWYVTSINFNINLGSYDKALFILEKHKDIIPKNYYYTQKIYSLVASNKLKESISCSEEAVKLEKCPSSLYNNISWAYFENGIYDKCIFYANKALTLSPNDEYPLVNKGNALLELKDFKSALSLFDKALESNPKFESAIISKAICLFSLKNYKEALLYFQKAYSKDSGNLTLLTYIAQCNYKQKKYLSASRCYEKLTKHIPNDPILFLELSRIYFDLGNFEKSLTAVDNSLLLLPTFSISHYLKCKILVKLRKCNEALDSLEDAVNLDPNLKKVAYDDELLDPLKIFPSFLKIVK